MRSFPNILYTVLILLAILQTSVQQQRVTALFSDCRTNEYFNLAEQKCQVCIDQSLEPTADKLGCQCKLQQTGTYYVKKTMNDQNIQNLQEYQLQVDYIGGLGIRGSNSCRTCQAGEICYCFGPQEVLISYNQNGNYIAGAKVCTNCAANAYPSVNKDRCIPCPDSLMTYAQHPGDTFYSCKCPAQSGGVNYATGGDKCIRSQDIPQDLVGEITGSLLTPSTYRFSGGGSATVNVSAYFSFYLAKSLAGCRTYEDPQSCNILANMCVMNLYNSSGATSLCKALKNPDTQNEQQQPQPFNAGYYPSPWIYYKTGIQNQIEKDKRFKGNVVLEKKLRSSNEVYYLNYYIAVYDIDGNFEDFRKLGQEFMLCPSSVTDGVLQKTFGTDYTNNCNVSLQNYINGYTTKFYELFLRDTDGSYYEVAVFIKNLVNDNGNQPNSNDNSTNKEAVRRFFILDNVSAREGSHLNTNQLKAIRYAKNIRFQINLQDDKDEYIYMPIVTIEYEDKQVQQTNGISELTSKNASIKFEVEYYYDPVDFWKNANWIFAVSQVICFIIWVIKCVILGKLNPDVNPSEPYSAYFAAKCVLIGLDLWADTVFYLLIILTGYWFIFFKMQQRSFVLLPSMSGSSYSDNYYYFDVLFWVMFGFKTVSMVVLVYKQVNIDIFFIDWEREKDLGEDEVQEGEGPGISVWRNLFVANEFNELQVERTVEIEWALFFLGLFMSGIGFENLAAETPDFELDVEDVEKIQKNYVLKYFVASFIFLAIGIVQLTVRKLLIIWWPLQIQNFNDLCSVGNISIIIFDSYLHGYYMHGKAPIGISEGNSQWLNLALHKEAKAHATRGLVKGTDLQCFEILVGKEFRQIFDQNIKFPLDMIQYEANQNVARMNQQNQMPTISRATPEYRYDQFSELENKKKNVQEYIIEQLSNVENNHANHVRDKSVLTRLLGWPGISPTDISSLPYFYKDPEYSIQKVIYLGQELNLLIFDIIMYCMWDIVTESTLISIVLTYLFDKGFEFTRTFFGKRNLAKKSLIDEMFLN